MPDDLSVVCVQPRVLNLLSQLKEEGIYKVRVLLIRTTGALIGNDDAFDAALRRCRCSTSDDH